MSAIFGIINKNERPLDSASINKIQKAIAHRATDGSGLWQNDNAALGFCKLIVYPQQINEQLPIEAGDIVLTADARIYNRDQLYSLLNLDKKQWALEADAYLILKAYQQWDEKCVDYLEGEYVFAIWNKVSKTLFMVTDHIGFRPVFYYDSPEQFIFCSEIKGVVAAKTTPNYFNEEHLIEYHFRQSPPNQTYNKEVFALCGGNTLTLVDGKVKIEKYWTLKPLGKYHFTKDEEWIECLRDLLYKAVEKRLNPDVPVGITLSGGLDSTSIACILSELLAKKNKPLYAFSSVLPIDHKGIEQDERKYIEIVNKHCPNIIQTYVEAPGAGPFTNVEDAFEKDEGIPNGFFYMDQAILEAAKQKNIRSLFSGYGGDFWVSWKGNTVIYQLIQKYRLKEVWKLLQALSINEQANLLQLVRREYLAYTTFYQHLRKIKRKEINWQERTALQDVFVKSHASHLNFKHNNNNQVFMQEYINNGRMGKCMGLFANRNEAFRMNSAIPLFDKSINDFLIEIPLALFIKNGYKRSLIRHVMNGIIPTKIQWRKDKLPYEPSYTRRTLENKKELQKILLLDEYSFVFDNYFETKKIVDNIDKIQIHAGFSGPTTVLGIRIMQVGISSIVLSHIKKEGYFFKKQ